MTRGHFSIILVLLVFWIASCSSNAQTVGISTGPQISPEKLKEQGSQLITKKIEANALKNNIIEEPLTKDICIYLPKSYESSNKTYPVLYFLPDYEGNYQGYGLTFSRIMDSLLVKNKAKEMIVVCINGLNRFNGSFYVNSPVTGNWEDFVADDVVSYMDRSYRTIKSPEARGLVGYSTGGFGAISIGMHHPEVFAYIYSISPSIFNKDGFEKCTIKFDDLKKTAKLKSREAYLAAIPDMRWPENFTYAYGAAFAPDVGSKGKPSKPPFIKIPRMKSRLEAVHDDTWKAWESGCGDWENKVKRYKENFFKLKGFIIESGTTDMFSWTPEGCRYLSDLLKLENIKHELIIYDGDARIQVRKRIRTDVIPYFSQRLKGE